jgi:hypothetical protein
MVAVMPGIAPKTIPVTTPIPMRLKDDGVRPAKKFITVCSYRLR